MQIRHPEALDDVGGQCPDRVTLGGDAYDCSDGTTFDVSRAQADALAERYDVDVERIAADDETDADPADGDDSGEELSRQDLIDIGRCPWCVEEDADDPYRGDHVGQHASSVHPDQWGEYNA